jgi:hypothetical protein
MTNRNNRRDTIDKLFKCLANAPAEVPHCTNDEVLAGCGLLVAAILRECYADPAKEAERFYATLRTCVDDRMLKARLLELRPSLN